MKIAFDVEQHDLAAALDRAARTVAQPEALRALWTTETGRDPAVWRAICDLGLPAILLPEEHEGAGSSLLDLLLVLERIGHHAVPDAIVESCVTGPIALTLAGSPTQLATWAPRLAAGEARVTVAMRGLQSVPDAHVSDVLVHRVGDELHVVATADCVLTPLVSMDPSRRQFAVEVPDGSSEPLTGSAAVLDAVLAHEAVASAAVLIGIASRMLDDTVAYVKIREQFGRTIGSFQAVKHQIADATALVAVARFQVHAASAKVAAGSTDALIAARAARLVAIDAEFEANRKALQLHGGIGFTWEHDLQLWLKRGKALEQAHGGRSEMAQALGAELLTMVGRR